MDVGSEALQYPGWCWLKPRAGAVLGEVRMSRALCCSCHLAAAPHGSVPAFSEGRGGKVVLLCYVLVKCFLEPAVEARLQSGLQIQPPDYLRVSGSNSSCKENAEIHPRQ